MTTSFNVANITSPLGLIAGNGLLPLQFVEEAKKLGLKVIIAAHENETSQEILDLNCDITWIKVGQLNKIIKIFSKKNVKNASFIGGIKRVKLFRNFRPDLRAIKIISKSKSLQDDVILRAIANEFESCGIKIIAPHVVLAKCIISCGILTKRTLTKQEYSDALIGWKAAKVLGELDIGQTVIVKDKNIIAVEGIEGTDATILRAGNLCQNTNFVVVKVSKPQQDLRLDLPTVGINTIENIISSGGKTLIVEASRTLFIDPQQVISLADRYDMAILGVNSVEELER
jgi:UDP-2,3-diacylglucosamine hydrolase